MSKLIEHLAISSGILDCLEDPYDKFNDGNPYGSVLPDMIRFAEIIIQHCLHQCEPEPGFKYSPNSLSARADCKDRIKEHFGVE